jgi:hypothetical protein
MHRHSEVDGGETRAENRSAPKVCNAVADGFELDRKPVDEMVRIVSATMDFEIADVRMASAAYAFAT